VSIQEVLYFEGRLKEAKMPRGAFVVNRVRLPPARAEGLDAATIAEAAAAHGLSLDPDGPSRILRAYEDANKLAALDTLHMRSLVTEGEKVPIVRIPELPTDVHDAGGLVRLSALLMAG